MSSHCRSEEALHKAPQSMPLLWAASIALASCASRGPTQPFQDPHPGETRAMTGMRPRAGQGRWGERILFEVAAIPAAWIQADPEEGATGSEDEPWGGAGYGARVAVGNRDQSIGLLYQGLELSRGSDDGAIHSACLDFDVRVPLEEGGGAFSLLVGAGFGVARFDSGTQGVDASDEGAAQLRAALSLHAARNATIEAGVGGFVYGHPGETEAFGTFVFAGISLAF